MYSCTWWNCTAVESVTIGHESVCRAWKYSPTKFAMDLRQSGWNWSFPKWSCSCPKVGWLCEVSNTLSSNMQENSQELHKRPRRQNSSSHCIPFLSLLNIIFLGQVSCCPFILSAKSHHCHIVRSEIVADHNFYFPSFSQALALYFRLSHISQTLDKQIQANSALPYPCVSNICQIRSGKYLLDKGWQIFCPINRAVVTWECFE